MNKRARAGVAAILLLAIVQVAMMVGGKAPAFNSQFLPVVSTSRNRTKAVIHMGVFKTGSTSIQMDSAKFNVKLQMDGYYIPYDEWFDHDLRQSDKQKFPMAYNQFNFSHCFRPTTAAIRRQCDPNLLLSGLRIAEQKRNLFVSSEAFARMDLQGIQDLSSYLARWDDIVVVVFYRHYYSWCTSSYNQWTKSRQWGETKDWEGTILDFLTKALKHDDPSYTAGLVNRLRPFFSNIKIANFHDDSKGGPSEQFYCHLLPHAKNTCEAVRGNNAHLNPARNLDYSDLAYAAHKAGIIKISSQKELDSITLAMKKFHHDELNEATYVWKRKCLPQESLTKLWKKSWEYKQMLFPNAPDNDPSLRKKAMKQDFNKAATTSMCAIDVEGTLSEDGWQNFFSSYTHG